MARPSLFTHRKLRRLARILRSEALAVGSLELIWHAAYADGDPRLGDESDVENAAKWKGKAGHLCAALVESSFVDKIDDEYHVHDLLDHAPDYVRKRAKREAERRSATGQRPVSDHPLTSTPIPSHPIPLNQSIGATVETTSAPHPPAGGKRKRKVQPNGYRPGFLEAWNAYPHFGGRSVKAAASKVWEQRGLEAETRRVLAWIACYERSPDWQKDDGKFVPGLQAWLRNPNFSEPPEVWK